jgi:beta-galactosidase
LKIGHVPGAAIGLNPGINDDAYEKARKLNASLPILSSETYPGWLTRWGEKWAGKSIDNAVNEIR